MADEEEIDFRDFMRKEALSASTPIAAGSDAIADKKASSAGDLTGSPLQPFFRKGSKKDADAGGAGRRVSMSTYRAESTESDETESSGPVSFEKLMGEERDRERKQVDSLRTVRRGVLHCPPANSIRRLCRSSAALSKAWASPA